MALAEFCSALRSSLFKALCGDTRDCSYSFFSPKTRTNARLKCYTNKSSFQTWRNSCSGAKAGLSSHFQDWGKVLSQASALCSILGWPPSITQFDILVHWPLHHIRMRWTAACELDLQNTNLSRLVFHVFQLNWNILCSRFSAGLCWCPCCTRTEASYEFPEEILDCHILKKGNSVTLPSCRDGNPCKQPWLPGKTTLCWRNAFPVCSCLGSSRWARESTLLEGKCGLHWDCGGVFPEEGRFHGGGNNMKMAEMGGD